MVLASFYILIIFAFWPTMLRRITLRLTALAPPLSDPLLSAPPLLDAPLRVETAAAGN